MERFQDIFAGLAARRTKSPCELDSRREFDTSCFSMVLFTLLNPVDLKAPPDVAERRQVGGRGGMAMVGSVKEWRTPIRQAQAK